jgi:16S rRNA (cytosine967-C5)-methyltransferase
MLPHPRTAARREIIRALVASEKPDFSPFGWNELDPAVRPFAREVTSGVWRWRSKLDWNLAPLLSRPLDKLDAPARAALRALAFERLELQTAPHALGSDYAELMRTFKIGSAAGFVNALARRLPDEWRALPRQLAFRLSVEFAHPLWLVERYLQRLGEPETRALLEANQERAPFDVRANSTRIARDELVARFRSASIEAQPTPHSPVGVRLSGVSSPELLPGWKEGWFFVQDEAAQLVGELAPLPEVGLVVDCASAPGGKATHLAGRSPKARVLACDLSAKRLELVSDNAARLRLGNIETRAGNWLDLAGTLEAKADLVLLDAPCLGTGTFRRRPDAKWRKTPEQLRELVALQRQLLDAAAKAVKVGGALVYSTCSLEAEENDEQALAFEARHANFERIVLAGAPGEADGFLHAGPHLTGSDGAFAAAWRRGE